MVNLVNGCGFLGNHTGKAACGDNLHVLAKFCLYPAHDFINLPHIAEDNPCLHALNGVAADNLLRRNQLDTRQLRRRLEQSIGTRADTGRNHAAHEIAIFTHHIIGGRRTDINDNQRTAILLISADYVHDTVSTNGTGIFVVQLNARLNAGAYDQRL